MKIGVTTEERYRIVEFDGQFNVRVLYPIEKRDHWWSKKYTVYQYILSDIKGKPMQSFLFQIPQPPFETLEAAREKAKSWMKGEIIHSV